MAPETPDLAGQPALPHQQIDDGFKAQTDRANKFVADVEARFEKVESLVEKSVARVMAALQQCYAQREKRIERLESGFRRLVGLQVTTLVAALGLAAKLS